MGNYRVVDFDVVATEPATQEVPPADNTVNIIEQELKNIQDKTAATHVIFASKMPPEQAMFTMLNLGIEFKVLLGKYKGNLETSYMIGFQNLGLIFGSGLIDEQESILVTGNPQKGGKREAFLVYNAPDNNGEYQQSPIERLGYFDVTVDVDAAMKLDAFSYDPILRAFYFVPKEVTEDGVTT